MVKARRCFKAPTRAGGEVVAVLCAICLILLFALSRFSGWMEQRLIAALGFLPERHGERIRRFVSAFLEGTKSTQSRLRSWGMTGRKFAPRTERREQIMVRGARSV